MGWGGILVVLLTDTAHGLLIGHLFVGCNAFFWVLTDAWSRHCPNVSCPSVASGHELKNVWLLVPTSSQFKVKAQWFSPFQCAMKACNENGELEMVGHTVCSVVTLCPVSVVTLCAVLSCFVLE